MSKLLTRFSLFVVLGWFGAGYPAYATEMLFKRECNGCHSAPPTCNGCHAHGVHAKTGDAAALNLAATTDAKAYTAGDDIVVTLTGGNQATTDGWVGFKLYDAIKGTALVHAKGELPATLTTRAYEGMTKIYVAWIGFDYDSAGAKYGAPMTGVIGEGLREAFRAGVHKDQVHIEEIVATNDFIVGAETTSTSGTDTSARATEDSAGGGAFDLLWILGGFVAAARRRDRWIRKATNAGTPRSRTSNAAPV